MNALTERYTDEAIAFIEKHKQRPFFVYLPYTMPHTRLGAGERFRGKSRRGLYGDVVEEIDYHTGRIVDAIKRLELQDNTYVIFTSDNGPWLIKNRNHRDGVAPADHGGSAASCAVEKCPLGKAASACRRSSGRPARARGEDLRPDGQHDGRATHARCAGWRGSAAGPAH